MCDDNLFTHQLPRASREAAPWLLKWFPQLEPFGNEESLKHLDLLLSRHYPKDAMTCWLSDMRRKFGITQELWVVPQIPKDAGDEGHHYQDPLSELIQMRESEKGIIVIDLSHA